MTQSPYADNPFEAEMMNEPPKTSALAVVSLVLSFVGCRLPVGLLGSLLGLVSLFGISGSQGRVTGKGLAIAAIIIGLINTGLWIGGGLAVKAGIGMYTSMTGPVLKDIEAGDFQAVRSAMDPSVSFSDAQLEAFRAAYQAELGSFDGVPQGMFELIRDFTDPAVGPRMQSYQGRNDMVPIPGRFDRGKVVVLFFFNPNAQGGARLLFNDIVIVLPNGDEIKLSDQPDAPSEQPDSDG